MKKLLSIFLIFILVFGLSSCASEQTNDEHNKKNSMPNEAPNHESFEDSWAFYALVTRYENFEKYTQYISSTPLPQNFVFYDDIADFGDFHTFTKCRNSNVYAYSLIAQDVEFLLIINIEDPTLYQNYNILSPTANTDLRFSPGTSERTEVFTHNGIFYCYHDGLLNNIYCLCGNIKFCLTPQSIKDFSSYTGDNVAINALLYKDKAGSVKLAFDNMMAQKAEAAK